jgi:hypothetical protein
MIDDLALERDERDLALERELELRRRALAINALANKAPLTKPQLCARGVPLATIYALANEGVIATIGPNKSCALLWVLREQVPHFKPTWGW